MVIGSAEIKCTGMGLFTTEDFWIHPNRIEQTYEIILVTEGCVYLQENETEYTLEKGDLLILEKGIRHMGFRESRGKTSFYWAHITGLPENLPRLCHGFPAGHLFKEVLHFYNLPDAPAFAAEAVIAHILAEIAMTARQGSALMEKVYEWVRINASASLTVQKTAAHFGYNYEYLSRQIRSYYGTGLKNIINRFLLKKAKDLLCNTEYSVKQIGAILGFSEPSAFVNYFKYHERTSPAAYRNRYIKTHMNRE